MKKNITLKGIPVSNGIGIAKIRIYHTNLDDLPEYILDANTIADELERYYNSLNEVNLLFLQDQKQVARDFGKSHAQIYETYHLIIEDVFFQEEIPETIRTDAKNAESVINKKLQLYEKHFEGVKDEYLRERLYDIRGVSRRLIYHLMQKDYSAGYDKEGSNLIIAKELTPADSIHFHHSSLKGIVTEFGGQTSHAAILARSLEVPALVGVSGVLKHAQAGKTAILDGIEGKLILNPDKEVLVDYRSRKRKYNRHKEKLLQVVGQSLSHLNNNNIKLLANINDATEINVAHKYKADGVGLYRTELSFIAKEKLLSEEEQFQLYKEILSAFPDKEVVIRLLDLGGDKFLPFSQAHREANPFLGLRSIRILLKQPEIFKIQLRAILRASIFGEVKILIPMISSREEILATKRIYNSAKEELKKQNSAFKNDIPIGIMVEIPSSAIAIDCLIDETDFISIGTNDLVQYTLAVDRNNDRVADFYQPLNPAVLRLIKMVAESGKEHNKPVSICGEIAGEPLYTQLLLSLGINQLSMQPSSLPIIKNIILHTNEKDLEEIREKITICKNINNFHKFLYNKIKGFV